MARIADLKAAGSDGQTEITFTKSESWCVPRCVGLKFPLSLLVLPAGSNPAPRTIFPCEIGHPQIIYTEFAQLNARTPDRRVRFPVAIRHRTSKAKIYAPRGKFAYYRLAYATAGKRRMQTFTNYSDAKPSLECEAPYLGVRNFDIVNCLHNS